jgi:hypothetical protein
MPAFVRIFCLVGLPMFALAALFIWKPAGSEKRPEMSLAARVAWTIFALAALTLLCFPIIFLPLVLFAIWKPRRWPAGATADRIAWTAFVFGIGLMLTMIVYTMTQESEGSWRSWETIRLHSRVFLAISMIPIAGPLIVYLIQPARERRSPDAARKSPVDDWDAEPPLG